MAQFSLRHWHEKALKAQDLLNNQPRALVSFYNNYRAISR
jgi:hypothetical protein